ncbi:MAG: restriction endonuclease subunit S, partial [Clostridiales bacterium]|nr:restriction endonuclease subunit S [Clostridiales bacterium]
LSVSKAGVVPQIATVAKTNNGDNRKLVRKGDFVINSRSDRRGSSGISNYDGSVSLINIVLKPRSFVNGRYMHYLLKSHYFIEEFYRNGRGIVADLWTTRYTEMKSIYLPVPSIEEQDQIVRFLDWKLAKINKLIRAKKKQIALLNEHKQVIINNAITKGLDSKVSMKNSGIEWIGETPTTWKIKRLKNVATTFGRIGFRGYSTVDLVDNEEDGAITTSPSNIKEDSMSFEKCSYLTWEKYEESPEIQLRENDILIVKTGSSYGKTGFIDSLPKKATINPQLLIVRNRSNELHSKFLYFVIKSRYFQDQIKCEIIGSTIPTISETKILSFFLAIPPKDVQEKLLVYIESVIDKHRLAIKKIEDEISLLQEYRIRLISDVVTGKIDVSDIEIPEYETDSDDFTDDEIDDNLVLDEEDGEMEVE